MNNNDDPAVPRFIRDLMPNATEEELMQAERNFRGYILALYRGFIERVEREEGVRPL